MLVAEKHYRVRELAALWSLSPSTITALFRHEDGVLRLGRDTGKRPYVTLSIPASIAERVHQRLSHDTLQTGRTGRHPRRIISFRDVYGGVPKKPRNIANRNATKQSADSKGIAESMGPAITDAALGTDQFHIAPYLPVKPRPIAEYKGQIRHPAAVIDGGL